jgi:hypothetical protein
MDDKSSSLVTVGDLDFGKTVLASPPQEYRASINRALH